MESKTSLKDFKLKWAHGQCKGTPSFISRDSVFIPCDFFTMSCHVSGKHRRVYSEPEIRIGCATAMPELGMMAVSERKDRPVIYVLNHPKMEVISILRQGNNVQYQALRFTAMEFLISVQVKNCYEIDLWRWPTGERLHFLSEPLLESEVPLSTLFVNPMSWSQICLQDSTRLVMLEIKIFEDKYHLDSKSFTFHEDDEGTINVCNKRFEERETSSNEEYMSLDSDGKTLTITCSCWLPGDDILVASSNSILKVDHLYLKVFTVHKLPEGKSSITSMALNKTGLFVAYKTGFIDVISLTRGRWVLMETIRVGQPIVNLLFSPNYDSLIINTSKGTLFRQPAGLDSLETLFRADSSGEIGVCIIGPLSRYCITAKKTGMLHVFRIVDGYPLSSFQLDEEISSVASSPLCCCVVIGSSSGFIYFMDVTDPCCPKIVHCVRPYEIPIDRIKFDNFGRFVVTSAQNQDVKIWNALPSSSFTFLGSKKVAKQVKDIAIFCRTTKEDTLLLILSEYGSSSAKEAGNILIRLKLPPDFPTDAKKYHIDVFGTLSSDALCFQKWRLAFPTNKMDIHWNFGAMFHSPLVGKIQRFPVWSESPKSEQNDILPSKTVTSLKISLDQRWLAVTDAHGHLQIYSASTFETVATTQKFSNSENICKSFINFSLFVDGIITGRGNGTVLYYEWTGDFSDVPEWMIDCHSHSEVENNFLKKMAEEERIDIISQKSVSHVKMPQSLRELQQELEIWIRVINFRLNRLLETIEASTDFGAPNFIIDALSLKSLSEKNAKKMYASGMTATEISTENKSESDSEEGNTKVLSSMSLGYVVPNYFEVSISSIENDKASKIKSHSAHKNEGKGNSSFMDYTFLSRGVKFKPKHERLAVAEDIRKKIHDLKVEFNELFDAIYSERHSIIEQISELYLEAKQSTQNLPSKAERDFWNALLEKSDFELEINTCPITNTSGNSSPTSSDEESIRNTKDTIQRHFESARSIKIEFDSRVENLFYKRLYCDYKIHAEEVRVFSVLMFNEMEEEFCIWKLELEEELKTLRNYNDELERLISEVVTTEKNTRQVYSGLQKLERNTGNKVETKCMKWKQGDDLYNQYKQQPKTKLGDGSNNPYWTPQPSITSDDLSSISQGIESEMSCPENTEEATWKNVVNKRTRRIKLDIFLRHLQCQSVELTVVKHKCEDISLKLTAKSVSFQRILDDIIKLKSNLNEKFHALLTTNLEDADWKLHGDIKRISDVSDFLALRSLPNSGHKFWKAIQTSAYRNQLIHNQLLELEKLFEHLKAVRMEITRDKSSLKYPTQMKGLKDTLEEYKQNFTKTKCVMDQVVELRKKSIFKYLTGAS